MSDMGDSERMKAYSEVFGCSLHRLRERLQIAFGGRIHGAGSIAFLESLPGVLGVEVLYPGWPGGPAVVMHIRWWWVFAPWKLERLAYQIDACMPAGVAWRFA